MTTIAALTTNVILDITVFVAFIIAVVSVGLIKSGGKGCNNCSEDYFLAGRGLSWWLIGISLIAANISTEQFVGMSGSAAGPTGMAIASYEWMAAIALVFVGWFFLPKFLKSGIYTIPQFLEFRFDAASRTVMSVLMVVTLVCVNITAVIYSGATVADTVFGHSADLPFDIDLTVACWCIGAIAAVYVCAGGLKAAAWADLLQGTALIIGGAIIAYFTWKLFAATPAEAIATTKAFSPEALARLSDAGAVEKFFTLNTDKLTMFRSASDPVVPWTALIIGLWIPNFYYWGLNQYIIQRTLGAKSLAEGQKGVMFAASLKLIIPFIIVIPGIIAFNLFSENQREAAMSNGNVLKTNAESYSTIYFNALENEGKPFSAADMVQMCTYPIGAKNAMVAVINEKKANELYAAYNADKAKGLVEKTKYSYDNGWAKSHPEEKKLIDAWNAKVTDAKQTKTLYGYHFDSAFGLLISKVLPEGFGLRGFIFAALLGAVVSSLAAMLNAASTIFTIDIYKKFIVPHASDKQQVLVGRISVLVFALIGCFVAPMLSNPNLGGVFNFIQEFQGFLSPGILAVFLFGLFSKRAPKFAGVLGIVTSPIVYGFLYLFFSDIAFLNRMAITFGCSLLVMLFLTLFKPLRQDVVMPVNEKMDVSSSMQARVAGIAVLIVTGILYFTFSGLWF